MQGSQLGSYELIRRLGEGGMAQVYLARDVRLGREVAVKVLDSRLAQRSGFRDRFLREARVAAALDHPSIVPLYDFGETGGLLYLVMPYISGGSLQDALKRVPFPVSEVVSYGTQITDALDYAHQRGVIHRDVKPANMLLHADGRLMLADFGLAKILDGSPRTANRSGKPDAGTPEYMAPEQIQGRTDARSDLYGLGVVLYLLLTGRLPFSGSSSDAVMDGHLYRLPDSPRRLNSAVTPALDEVVMRALAKRPEDRYQRASEMGAALLEALVAGDAERLDFASGPSGPVFSRPPSLPHVSAVPGYQSPFSPGYNSSQGSAGGRSGGHTGMTTSFLPSLDVPAANSQFSAVDSPGPTPSHPFATGTPYGGAMPEQPFSSRPRESQESQREFQPTQPIGRINVASRVSAPSEVAVADSRSQISQGMRASEMASALSPLPSLDAEPLDEQSHGSSRWLWMLIAGLLVLMVIAGSALAYIFLRTS